MCPVAGGHRRWAHHPWHSNGSRARTHPPLSPRVVWKLPGPGRTSRAMTPMGVRHRAPAAIRRGSGPCSPNSCSIPPSPKGGHDPLRPDHFGGENETSVSLHRGPRPSECQFTPAPNSRNQNFAKKRDHRPMPMRARPRAPATRASRASAPGVKRFSQYRTHASGVIGASARSRCTARRIPAATRSGP